MVYYNVSLYANNIRKSIGKANHFLCYHLTKQNVYRHS